MKRNFTIKKWSSGIILCLSIVSLASCDRNENVANVGEGNVIINVGIEQGIEGTPLFKSVGQSTEDEIIADTTYTIGDMEISTQFISHKVNESAKFRSSSVFGKMDAGVKYGLYFREEGSTSTSITGNPHNSFIVGEEEPRMQLEVGKTYNWYAVSSNVVNLLPEVSEDGEIAPEDYQDEIVYATGKITVADGDNFLNVRFERKSVRIDVDVNAKGMLFPMFGGEFLLKNSEDEGAVKKTKFNIWTGEFTADNSIAEDYKGILGDEEVKKTLSSYDFAGREFEGNSLTLHIKNLKFKNYAGRDLEFADVNIPLYNPLFSTEVGKKYTIKVNVKQSPVEYNEVYWARGNLFRANHYSGAGGFGPDIFDLNPVNRYQDLGAHVHYWNWKSETPNGDPGSGDPCLKIFPENSWRLPTVEDAEKLAENVVNMTVRPGLVAADKVGKTTSYPGMSLGFGEPDSYATANWGNYSNFYLPFCGYRNVGVQGKDMNAANISGWSGNEANDGNSYSDVSAYYWTSTPVDSDNTKAKALKWTISFVGNGTTTEANFATNGEIVEMDKRAGLSVRCVRNNN